MTQALPKGGNAAIAQADPTARALFVGLSWEAPPAMSSVVIDASVFLLNADGVVRDDSDFVFYNQEADTSGAVYRLPTDELDRTQDQDGFVVVLSALSEDVPRLAFCLTLDTASTPDATFGAVSWVRARLVNHDSGQEFLRYRDNDDVDQKTALIVAELYRHPNGWKFKAKGEGFAGGLQALAAHFGVLVADEDSPSANVAVTEEALAVSALTLEKEATGPEATGKRRRRRTLQDVLAAQVEEIKTRYRTIQPLLKRALQSSPNESQSRLLLDRILQDVLGYALTDIKTEQKIKGRFADYVLALNGNDVLVIEAKRLFAPLGDKQIFQANTYAAFSGIHWAVLTNILNWRLYRVSSRDAKVETDLVFTIDLQNGLDDENAYRLTLLSKSGLARGELLERLWRKTIALSQQSLIAAILHEDVLNKIRTVLLREHRCTLTNQEIQDAIERKVLR